MFKEEELDAIRRTREEWELTVLGPIMEKWPERKGEFRTQSGHPVKRVYTPEDIAGKSYVEDISFPGWYPFTRGVFPTGYRANLWTRRLITGLATPEETNKRLKFLIEQGQTGLNIIYDNPTTNLLDSDNPLCEGEVGRDGVPTCTLRDMEVVMDGIDMRKVSTSIIHSGPFILSMYLALAEKRGIPFDQLRGTLQNDVLSQYYTVNMSVVSLRDGFRLSADVVEYCRKHVPRWNPISFVGYQIREAGSTAAQEIAFAIGSAIGYTEELMGRGMDVDDFAPRLSFMFNCHNDFFEEICKLRAARRLWARIMRERFGAKNPLSWLLRFHVQTAGSSLTAQQPINNVIRTTIQAMAAVLGGTNSLHTNSMDECYCLPSEYAARTALRTQQIIAYESGVANTVDPLAGSYFVEKLTDDIEAEAEDILRQIDGMGGMVAALEAGWVQREVVKASNEYHRKLKSGEITVVGVNMFQDSEDEEVPIEILRIDPAQERHQVEMLRQVKERRDKEALRRALERMKEDAAAHCNIVPSCMEAVKAYATLEDMRNALQEALGAGKESKDAFIC
ncbi:MAG: methylmalonyl-CoA mutase [Actinobacteria bacterium]|nr:methylmalonyl-CoA mutase [Actinomycetota bacterium]